MLRNIVLKIRILKMVNTEIFESELNCDQVDSHLTPRQGDSPITTHFRIHIRHYKTQQNLQNKHITFFKKYLEIYHNEDNNNNRIESVSRLII